MQLHVYARAGHLMSHPGMKFAGQINPYIGRRLVLVDGAITHPPLADGEKLDSASQSGRRIVSLMSRNSSDPPLWAADKETAAACSVGFIPVELGPEGEFVPAQPKPTKPVARAERADP